MKARDIMTTNPECITPDSTVQDAARLMRDGGFGAIPVVDDNSSLRVVGIITDRDIAVRHVAECNEARCMVRDHMTGDIEFVRTDDNLSEVEELMADEQIRRVPVVDENERLVGMIAQADLARSDSPSDVGETVKHISRRGGDHTNL